MKLESNLSHYYNKIQRKGRYKIISSGIIFIYRNHHEKEIIKEKIYPSLPILSSYRLSNSEITRKNKGRRIHLPGRYSNFLIPYWFRNKEITRENLSFRYHSFPLIPECEEDKKIIREMSFTLFFHHFLFPYLLV